MLFLFLSSCAIFFTKFGANYFVLQFAFEKLFIPDWISISFQIWYVSRSVWQIQFNRVNAHASPFQVVTNVSCVTENHKHHPTHKAITIECFFSRRLMHGHTKQFNLLCFYYDHYMFIVRIYGDIRRKPIYAHTRAPSPKVSICCRRQWWWWFCFLLSFNVAPRHTHFIHRSHSASRINIQFSYRACKHTESASEQRVVSRYRVYRVYMCRVVKNNTVHASTVPRHMYWCVCIVQSVYNALVFVPLFAMRTYVAYSYYLS